MFIVLFPTTVEDTPTLSISLLLVPPERVKGYLPKIFGTAVVSVSLFFFSFFFILRRMGKNRALAHHASTFFHTRRVSI